MLKSLQVLLNDTHSKHLTGIPLWNYLEKKAQLVTTETTDAPAKHDMINRLQLEMFMEEQSAKFDYEFSLFKGRFDDQMIHALSTVADLLVIDRQNLNEYCGGKALSDLLEKVACPILILPSAIEITGLIMLHDGTVTSVQTIKSFLGLFNRDLRQLPLSVLVEDPEESVDIDKERALIDYLKMFFNDIGVQLMDDDPENCYVKLVETAIERPLVMAGGKLGESVLNCNAMHKQVIDQAPCFIYRGNT